METITIPLTQGKETIIDGADWPLVSPHRWWAAQSAYGCYAVTKIRMTDGTRKVVHMQRLIMGEPEGLHVDHRSRDTLDNRRSNLRIATRSQNKANTPRYRNNVSGFKGVYRKARNARPWQAQIRINNVLHQIGAFAEAEAAARAYDVRARELYGPFARCNFPLP